MHFVLIFLAIVACATGVLLRASINRRKPIYDLAVSCTAALAFVAFIFGPALLASRNLDTTAIIVSMTVVTLVAGLIGLMGGGFIPRKKLPFEA